MCNYMEQPAESKDSIIIPGLNDRKSTVVAVHEYLIVDSEFELFSSGKKSYVLEYDTITHAIGDIFNFREHSAISGSFTGRTINATVTHIHRILFETVYVISFKINKEAL